MEVKIADIVRAAAGRDKGKLFYVVKTDGKYALIADGKCRKIEKPKRKKMRHLVFLQKGDCRAAAKLTDGEKVTNNELRRALAAFAAMSDGEEGGM